jgi:Ni/Co efflux regulator RcnB
MKKVAATITSLMFLAAPLASYAAPDDRQDRREERGRSDERQDKRDCRQEEGYTGQDKRECKQEEVRDGVRGNQGERVGEGDAGD